MHHLMIYIQFFFYLNNIMVLFSHLKKKIDYFRQWPQLIHFMGRLWHELIVFWINTVHTLVNTVRNGLFVICIKIHPHSVHTVISCRLNSAGLKSFELSSIFLFPKFQNNKNVSLFCRDSAELQKPAQLNLAVLTFYKYVKAARDGQDQKSCLSLNTKCAM